MATKKTPKTIPPSKPRNLVAKNAKTGGAGKHADKKKAAKQGETKHKQSYDTYEACWDNYKQFGMKTKNGKSVPDCRGPINDDMSEDWQKVNKHDKTDGMSSKAVKAYRRENPGSKLQTAVTKKPSELKAGSKDANRRKSFCARMSGVKGPMKDEHGKPTAKAKALSRWNCNESIDLEGYKGNITDTELTNVDPADHSEGEGDFIKNQLHTMKRVITHLTNAIGNGEEIPDWVQSEIAQATDKIVGVMDYSISSKEQDIEKHHGGSALMREQGPQRKSKYKNITIDQIAEALLGGMMTPPTPAGGVATGVKPAGPTKPGAGGIEGQVAALATQFANLQKNTDQQKKTFETMLNALSQRMAKLESSQSTNKPAAPPPSAAVTAKQPTAEHKFTEMELALMEGGHSLDPAPLRKRKVKENYDSYLKSVLTDLTKRN